MNYANNILHNVFDKKQPLYVLSSSRSKKEFYVNFIQKSNLDYDLSKYIENQELQEILSNCFELFDFTCKNTRENENVLPDTLTIDEFFKKVVYTKKGRITRHVRDFFMLQVLQNVKMAKKNTNTNIGFLNFDESFILFLQTSSVLLNFYNELKEHKIPITQDSLLKFSEIDSYDIYAEQLDLLSIIYDEYQQLLESHDLIDSVYSNEIAYNYDIFQEYIESFSSIHIELEGFISPLQYEILQNISQITPVFLHFSTDMYNIMHFKFIENKLNADHKYIYSISNQQLFSIDTAKLDIDSIKLYKTSKPLNQVNLALYLANKWEKEILNNRASENDFAIILPNESFCNYLITFDSCNLLNFAMGIDIAYMNEYSILDGIYNNFLHTKVLDLELLFESDFIAIMQDQTNTLRMQCRQDSTIIDEPNIYHLESLISILFNKDEVILYQVMSILSELSLLINKIYHDFSQLEFEKIFISFMHNIRKIKKNDVRGGKIKVIGALEARSLAFKEVLILDFTDDYIPNVTHDDMFLNSKIRKHYNMPTRLDKENLYKHHYYNIMKNSQITHISFVSNDIKIPSNMLFELHCDLDLAQSIDKLYSYYDTTEQRDITFYNEEYPTFQDSNYSSFSATSLNIYNNCRRKFYFCYIENLKEVETTQQQHIGVVLHNWLRESYEGYTNKILTIKDIDEIESHFLDRLQKLRDSRDSGGDINEFQIDTLTFIKLDNFVPKIRAFFELERYRVTNHSIQIVGLEYDIKTKYGDYEFKGKIDRIDIVDSDIVVFDYKTGANPPNNKDLQMPFYSICIDSIEDFKQYKNKSFSYYLLSEQKDKMQLPYKEKMIIDGIETINEILKEFGKNNTMTDNLETCRNCPYTILCNRR